MKLDELERAHNMVSLVHLHLALFYTPPLQVKRHIEQKSEIGEQIKTCEREVKETEAAVKEDKIQMEKV